MKLTVCSPGNSLLEGDLESAAERQAITKMVVLEIPEGFCVAVQLRWEGEKTWYLTTRRCLTEPKKFKELNRLHKYLNKIAQNQDYEVLRNQIIPT
jgi:hypothetical protein